MLLLFPRVGENASISPSSSFWPTSGGRPFSNKGAGLEKDRNHCCVVGPTAWTECCNNSAVSPQRGSPLCGVGEQLKIIWARATAVPLNGALQHVQCNCVCCCLLSRVALGGPFWPSWFAQGNARTFPRQGQAAAGREDEDGEDGDLLVMRSRGLSRRRRRPCSRLDQEQRHWHHVSLRANWYSTEALLLLLTPPAFAWEKGHRRGRQDGCSLLFPLSVHTSTLRKKEEKETVHKTSSTLLAREAGNIGDE